MLVQIITITTAITEVVASLKLLSRRLSLVKTHFKLV